MKLTLHVDDEVNTARGDTIAQDRSAHGTVYATGLL